MKLIVGLGNPGKKYQNNRHNVGYMVVDRLQTTAHGKDVIIKKSNAFMNDSGSFVAEQIKNLKLKMNNKLRFENLVIIHDDLDLPLGSWKMQIGKGPKEHGGINDIEQKLGTKVFTRIRVGVDNRKPEPFDSPSTSLGVNAQGKEYVLQDFTKEEKEILERTIDEICKKLATTLKNIN